MGVLLELALGEGADRQGIHVAAQHPRCICYRLTAAYLAHLGVEVDGLATKPGHGHREAHPSAGGGLAEDQAEGFAA